MLYEKGDFVEYQIDRYVVDILRGQEIIEIQTHAFYKLRRKLAALLEKHTVKIVHPVAKRKWITRQNINGEIISRRKSPKKENLLDIFHELVYIPNFLNNSNLAIEVFIIEKEEVLIDDGKGSWRRKGWSLADQKLLQVYQVKALAYPDDYQTFFSGMNTNGFLNSELAEELGCSVKLARKITYTLVHSGLLTHTGMAGNAKVYALE